MADEAKSKLVLDPLADWRRSHNCGEARLEHAGTDMLLAGWVHSVRDHGGLLFVDLRDKTGWTQVVFDPGTTPEAFERAQSLRSEWVIAVRGALRHRGTNLVNSKIPTGEVELAVDELKILNRASPPPFPIADDINTSEEVRLRHRPLDLRRPIMQKRLYLRHKVCMAVRIFMDRSGFTEVETPILMKSTPEGARDYLVPSRQSPGMFYALPQSPQILKQLLMVAGTDKYFQIARCFRDEDLRADRQPEFAQIDIEMAFVGEEEIFSLVEKLYLDIFKASSEAGFPHPLPELPFPRMTYTEAISRYGTDKPDTRYEMFLRDITEVAKACSFKVFREAAEKGGLGLAMSVPQGGDLSRKDIDALIKFCRGQGAGGMAWMKVTEKGLESNVAKFFSSGELDRLREILSPKVGDLLVFVVELPPRARAVMDALRRHLAGIMGLIKNENDISLCWVTEFPLFLKAEDGSLISSHHPFTAPREEDLALLETNPLEVKSRAYDLVANGIELSSGSIRIHTPELLGQIMKLLGHSPQEIEDRFGFMLENLGAGAPPHGGFAPGIDRTVMLMAGVENIREVTAFPKTQKGIDLFAGSPTAIDPSQLKDLGLAVLED